MFHNKGPKDVPWEHPLTKSFQMLVVPFNLTLFCLLIKCDFIRPSGSSETPNALSLFISSAERKESKGLLISGDNNPGLSTLSDNLEESKFWTVSAGLKITLWDFPD